VKIFIANTDSDMVSLHGGVHIFLFMILFLFITADSTSLYAAEEPIKSKSALPGEPCQTKPLKSWTSQEKWVWKQVCEGKIADFNKAEGYGGNFDPKKPEGWPENRILQPSFLETILLYEPYRGALTRNGVRIKGAWFKEPLDLSNAILAHKVWLDDSRFESNVDLSELKSSHLISLEGSKFNGKLNMYSLRVDSSLNMRRGEFAEVDLVGAKIGDQLHVEMSKFNSKLNMVLLQVEGSFLVQSGEFAEVVLVGAKIGGGLHMEGSTFTGQLNILSRSEKVL
jgi:hypothetical protein